MWFLLPWFVFLWGVYIDFGYCQGDNENIDREICFAASLSCVFLRSSGAAALLGSLVPTVFLCACCGGDLMKRETDNSCVLGHRMLFLS